MKETFETTAQELGGEAKVIIEKSYPGFKLENDDKVTQFAINSARELGLAGDTVIAEAAQMAVLLIHLESLQSF